jgi:hypothetical protein
MHRAELALTGLAFERVLDYLRMIEDNAKQSGTYAKSAVRPELL